MTDALATEWLKLRSGRRLYLALGVMVAFVGLAALVAWYVVTAWDSLPPEQRNRPGTGFSSSATLTAWVAELSLAVLGALTITSEYASGMIRTTLTVMPARRAVLAAKAAVVAAVAGVAGQAAVLAAFFVTWLIVDGRPIRGQPTSIAGELPLLFALGLEVVVFALLGLSLGAIMRSAAAAIATLLGLWYLGPMITANLPPPWDDRISSFLPSALAGQLAGTGNEGSTLGALLPPPAALAVIVAYIAVPLGVALVLLSRRDA
jgi:ABC-2 type transport system permease protein